MSDIKEKISFDLEESEIGKMALFQQKDAADDALFSFANNIADIGVNNSILLKNNTTVLILADPAEAHHSRAGKILVSKVLAHTIIFVCTKDLIWQ